MDKVEDRSNFVECSHCMGFGECWLVTGENPCGPEMERYPCSRCNGRGRVSATKVAHDKWKQEREAVRRDDYEQYVLPLMGTIAVLVVGFLAYVGVSLLVRDSGRLWGTFVFVGWGSLGVLLLLSILDSILAHKSALGHRTAEKAWNLTHPEPPCPEEKGSLDCFSGW